jgi:hypothetical protein
MLKKTFSSLLVFMSLGCFNALKGFAHHNIHEVHETVTVRSDSSGTSGEVVRTVRTPEGFTTIRIPINKIPTGFRTVKFNMDRTAFLKKYEEIKADRYRSHELALLQLQTLNNFIEGMEWNSQKNLGDVKINVQTQLNGEQPSVAVLSAKEIMELRSLLNESIQDNETSRQAYYSSMKKVSNLAYHFSKTMIAYSIYYGLGYFVKHPFGICNGIFLCDPMSVSASFGEMLTGIFTFIFGAQTIYALLNLI